MPKPPEMPEKYTQPKDVINVMYQLAMIDAAAVLPLLRSGFGTHAFAGYLLAMGWMFFCAGFGRCPILLKYIPVWLVVIIFRRLTASRQVHSNYQGNPWVFGWLIGDYAARFGELIVVFAGAVAASALYPPLVTFLMLKIVTLSIVFGCEQSVVAARKRAIRDAQLEADWMNRIYRDTH